MRGSYRQTDSVFSYVSPEALVPSDHPLRPIRVLVNRAVERLSGEFDTLYAAGGRDPIAPEKLLRVLLLQAFYSVRSERRLMEQVTYNMLFRWFIGLSMDAPVWDATVFTKNRDRLLRSEVAGKVFTAVLADPEVKPLLSFEHFSADGTLIGTHPPKAACRAAPECVLCSYGRSFERRYVRGAVSEMESITGVERRRHWRDDEKLQVLAELKQLGTKFVEVTRRHQISRGLLWQWRDAQRRGKLVAETSGFVPVRVVPELPSPGTLEAPPASAATHDIDEAPDDRIEIVLPDGTAVRVTEEVSTAALRRALAVLRG